MFGLINYKVYVEQGTGAVGLDIIFVTAKKPFCLII